MKRSRDLFLVSKYRYYNLKNGEDADRRLLSESELHQVLAEGVWSLDEKFYGTSAAIVSGVNNKPDSGFRDVLKRIKRANPRSNIETF